MLTTTNSTENPWTFVSVGPNTTYRAGHEIQAACGSAITMTTPRFFQGPFPGRFGSEAIGVLILF